MIASSSLAATTTGVRTSASRTASSSRASRSTSWADGGSGGRGGRRSTQRSSPRAISNVTFEWPSPIGSASTGPLPSPFRSRKASSGRRTSSGGRSSFAASSGVSTMALIGRNHSCATATRTPPARCLPSMLLSLRNAILPLALALAALAIVPAAGHASPQQVMTFEAPTELLDDGQRDQTLDEIRGFGVDRIRQLVYWNSYAPHNNS